MKKMLSLKRRTRETGENGNFWTLQLEKCEKWQFFTSRSWETWKNWQYLNITTRETRENMRINNLRNLLIGNSRRPFFWNLSNLSTLKSGIFGPFFLNLLWTLKSGAFQDLIAIMELGKAANMANESDSRNLVIGSLRSRWNSTNSENALDRALAFVKYIIP